MASQPSVSDLFGPPRQKSYRLAVVDTLRKVKRDNGLTLVDLAEKLGCSDQTLRNAMDEDGTDCLNPVTMLRIGYEFGDAVIDPIIALSRRTISEPKTMADRLIHIQQELASLGREMDA